MMKFLVQARQKDDLFFLVYRKEDYSFDVEPRLVNGFTSIMINDLQLELDEEGRVIYVWGLCPLINYQETNEIPRDYTSNSLIVLLDKPPIPGVSYRINENERWPIYINKKNGWVCLGDQQMEGRQAVEFAPNCVAVLNHQEMTAIWLHPKNLPELKGDVVINDECYPCPCCGFLTRSEPDYGTFEICPICGWEDDDVQFNDPDYRGGANQESLNEARENYKTFGASSKEDLEDVRGPLPDEIP